VTGLHLRVDPQEGNGRSDLPGSASEATGLLATTTKCRLPTSLPSSQFLTTYPDYCSEGLEEPKHGRGQEAG
jgi:hypothetical protein